MRLCFAVLIYLDLILYYVQSENQKCVSVVAPDFQLCADGEYRVLSPRQCQHQVHVCKRGFNISFIRLEPFQNTHFKDIVEEVINHCCGVCSNTLTVHNFSSMMDVTHSSIQSSHIVYPILGRIDVKSLHGFNFLPFWDVPGAYYVTKKRTKRIVAMHLINSCLNLWPLFVVMILMAVISGFVVWVIETWINKEMFHPAFVKGLFDGFWWSLVTMTTVGYGDKAPTFLPSRLFSVIWIFIGITISSMFTASLTTEITSAASAITPTLHGARVGVLKQHLYESSIVAKHGGTISEAKGLDLYTDINEMIAKLTNDEISGFLLNKFAYYHAKTYFTINKTGVYKDSEDFFQNHALQTEVQYGENKLAFGALVKIGEYYDFLKDFMLENRLSMETCITLWSNVMRDHIQHDKINEQNVFSPESGLLIPTIIATCSILGAILLFGVIYEGVRAKFNLRRTEVKNTKGNNVSDIVLQNVPTGRVTIGDTHF